MKTDEWRKVLGCWEQIVTIDPANVRARFGKLRYRYEVADSLTYFGQGASGHWKEVKSQAVELLDVVQKAGLLEDDVAKWQAYPSLEAGEPNPPTADRRMGPYLYLLRGRATSELVSMGVATEPDELLREATDDLDKAQKLEPNNVDAYKYLADVAVAKGELLASRGSREQRDVAAKQAREILEQAVKILPDSVAARVNLLSRKLALARRGEASLVLAQVSALEPEYDKLVKRFPSSPEAFSALAEFYTYCAIISGPKDAAKRLDESIAAAEKASELGKTTVPYALMAANLHYRKFSIYKHAPDMPMAVEIAENALKFPQAQETSGPNHFANLMNRFSLLCFLANCYVEQILESAETVEDSQKKMWLANAEQVVHEIEQIQGSGENPQVVKWQGMLELAKGNTTLAVQKLYAAYEQFKAAGTPGQSDAVVAYKLAKIFMESPEVGAVAEFLATAINSGIANVKPESYLEYGQVVLRFALADVALNAVTTFEERFGSNQQSKNLRVAALIAKGHITEAEEEMAKLDPDSLDTIKLKLALVQAKSMQLQDAIRRTRPDDDLSNVLKLAKPPEEGLKASESVAAMTSELSNNRRIESELVRKLLVKGPYAIEDSRIVVLCEGLIAAGQVNEARELVDSFLQHFPDNTVALFYKELLLEQKPDSVTQEKRQEIQKRAMGKVTDPAQRALGFGLYYRGSNQPEEAISEFKKVLEITASTQARQQPVYAYTAKASLERVAVEYLLDMAREAKNWGLAEEVVKIVQQRNLDDCQGEFFAARLALAKTDYKTALNRLDECLRQKPVFSQAYVLKGNVQMALGNEQSAISDIRKAVSLNPTDGVTAKALANALYVRNSRLGDSVSSEQKLETKNALERAIQLNLFDTALLAVYADYISSDEPLKTLALRQALQKGAPSLRNAVELGKLATRVALKETDKNRKETFFGVAQSAFEQARQIDPQDVMMLDGYAEYYRAVGQPDKAKQLLLESKDDRLLWRYYYRLGRIDEARRLLDRLYQQNNKDSDVLKGLILAAERYGDADGVQRYFEQLVSVEDNTENRVWQVRTLLDMGLVVEAQHRLQSLKEKYPNESAALLLEAWLAMRQGQLKKAMDLVNKNLETDQDDAYLWRLRGEICLLTASYDQAISDLKKSKSLSDMTPVRVSLAKAYLWAGRDDDAITELKSTLERTDAPEEARMLLEEIYLRTGRKAILKRFYDETLQRFPESARWYNRAAAFAMDCKEFNGAEQLYKQAYDLKRKQYTGQALNRTAIDLEYARALDGYLRSLVLSAGEPNSTGKDGWHPEKLDKVFEEGGRYIDSVYAPIVLYGMAEAKLRLGDRKAVVEYCHKAVDRAWENDIFTVEVLLRVFLLLGPDEVTRYCQERLKTDPDSLPANFAMFNLAKIKGEYDDAINYIDKCISLVDPNTPQGNDYMAKKAQILTVAYEKTSDNRYLEKAIRDYESLLDKMPNSTGVLNNLAYVLAQGNQKLPKALEYAKRALELKPNDGNFLDTYAFVLHKAGKNSEAAESLTAAIQQYALTGGPPAEVYEHLGMVKEALGDKSQAVAAYKRALEVGANSLSDIAKERIKSAIGRLMQ
jgi:tetratricopeptide (TPR) repeat protein